MAQTSLGGVSNSASKAFTNAKGNMALVNFGKIHGSQNQFDFDMKNQNNQTINTFTNTFTNTNTNTKIFSNQSIWSGTYNKNIIY
jgi:hypothetical protein